MAIQILFHDSFLKVLLFLLYLSGGGWAGLRGVCVCVCMSACRWPWLSQPCQGGGWTSSVPMWGCLGTGRATEAQQPSSFSNCRLSQPHSNSSAAAGLAAAKVPAHGGACPSPCRPDEEAGPGVAGLTMSPDPTGPHRQAAGVLRLALD